MTGLTGQTRQALAGDGQHDAPDRDRQHSPDPASSSSPLEPAHILALQGNAAIGQLLQGAPDRDPQHSPDPASSSFPLGPAHILALQRSAGNAATGRLLQRAPADVSTVEDVLLDPVPASPPQVRVLGNYSDQQISTALYGLPDVPVNRLNANTVEIHYSTLLPKWKPAFRESATDWEKNESDRREKIGHSDDDGKVVWEDKPVWTPVVDHRRGGLVVGYKRSSGGYTEVRNTAGEMVFVDEIPIERVRIPVIDDIIDALGQAGYVAVGLVDAVLEDNWRALGLPPHPHPLGNLLGIPGDAVAYRIGRGAGHAVALLQAAAEMVGGASLIVGGAGEFLVGVATTPAGGAGLVIMPVAVVTVAAGTTVLVHGGVLAGAVFMNAMSGDDGGGGGDEGGGGGRRSRGRKDDLKQVDDVAREYKMTKEQRQEFGEFLESEKGAGNGGTANSRGDFTYQELRRKAAEFIELFGR